MPKNPFKTPKPNHQPHEKDATTPDAPNATANQALLLAKTAEIAALHDQLAESHARVEELTNDLKRTRADFENFRRNAEEQKRQSAKLAKNTTVAKLLPLIDDLSRAIAANPDSLAPLAKNFDKTLTKLGLTKINSSKDSEFDPDLHEAISSEGDGDNDFIAETLRDGYYYESELLRPALVRVIKK
ncbi:nucleotide exchange factor GrpE [Candidatus Saccharibacteria bacterium]|nr:nucleotide exchange factor GrpE [Candidatus Saccharibacteria bacterium]